MPLFYGNLTANSIAVTNNSAATVATTVTGASGQSVDIFDVKNNAGNVLLSVAPTTLGIGSSAVTATVNAVSTGGTVTLNDGFGDVIAGGSVVAGNASTNQVALAGSSTNPTVTAQGGGTNISLALVPKGTGGITTTAQAAAAVPLSLVGAASATGDFFDVTYSGGTAGAMFKVVPASSTTQTLGISITTAAAGGAPIIDTTGAATLRIGNATATGITVGPISGTSPVPAGINAQPVSTVLLQVGVGNNGGVSFNTSSAVVGVDNRPNNSGTGDVYGFLALSVAASNATTANCIGVYAGTSSAGSTTVTNGYGVQVPVAAGNAFSTFTGVDIAAQKSGGGATITTGFGINQHGASDLNRFTGLIQADGGVDRSTAATLNVGTATATAVQVGRSGQNLGFYAATPVARASAITAVVTTGSTNVTPFGYTTAAQADSIPTRINAIITALQNIGITL